MGTCEICGGEVKRNGRGELIHVDYMEHAYDHHAQIEELHSDS